MKDLVLASSNKGKIAELQLLLTPLNFRILAQSHFAISDADETGNSFVENALIKARHAAHLSGLPAIADDSGLCVDALDGAPGIYSARYAGENASDADNNAKLLLALKNVSPEKRTARFHCALVFVSHADDKDPIICEETWEGSILMAPQGEHGFGYDPLFWVPSHHCSSAQLSIAEKNKLSHRAHALHALVAVLQKNITP
jgi:XTP/dITP diphosphohydrolase